MADLISGLDVAGKHFSNEEKGELVALESGDDLQ